MGVRLLLALLATLVLGAARLQGQDSSDGSDSSDTSTSTDASSSDAPSEAAAVSDVGPDAVTVTDASNGVAATDAVDNVAPTLAVNQNSEMDPATQQAIDAVNDPWGGTPQPIDFASGFVDVVRANPVPGAPSGPAGGGPGGPGSLPSGASGVPGSPGGPGGSVPGGPPPGGPGGGPAGGGAGEDVRINAVIVTGAVTPWGAIRKVAGIRNVYVTGGIIALGQTPLPGELPPGRPQPKWLHVIPDLSLLRGERFPPVVPNIIDVRIMYFPVEADPAAVQSAAGPQKAENQQKDPAGQEETSQAEADKE